MVTFKILLFQTINSS